MNKITKLAAGIALATCATVSTSAFADVSYNVGYASEYYFRGIAQSTSSASAGVDYDESGFYAGAWTASLDQGVEVDGYFGYGIETDAGLTASVGYTGYYYTQTDAANGFDTYKEVNLNVGYGIASVEYSFGDYENGLAPSTDYDFVALTLEHNGFYGTYGSFGDQADGDYAELGYGFSAADIDFGISAIFSDDNLNGGTQDEAIIFTIGKSF